ncbi:MAG: hypothetical protein M3P51_00545, partial [Chloroflexota bacterium]|nr:hypothetical protein [Chloroflexota bacterium]
MNYRELWRLFEEVGREGMRLTVTRARWHGGWRVYVRDNVTDTCYGFTEYSPFARLFPDFPSRLTVGPAEAIAPRDPYLPAADLVWREVLAILDQIEDLPGWEPRETALTEDGGYKLTLVYTGVPWPACGAPGHTILGAECPCAMH